MPLTLSQVLFIILTVAAVVAVVFLVQLFAQLRKTAAEAEKALVEVRALAKNLSELDFAVKARVDEFGDTLRASKKAALSVSEASFLVTSKFLQPSSKLLPLLLPVARFVLRQVKKRKEKKNVQ
jgi:hypothetical protein